jgi:hypothetical protein
MQSVPVSPPPMTTTCIRGGGGGEGRVCEREDGDKHCWLYAAIDIGFSVIETHLLASCRDVAAILKPRVEQALGVG